MKKLILGSFSLLFASVMTAPAVRAQTETMTETGTTRNQPATQIEKLRQQTNGRYQQTDSQVEQQGTGMEDEQQPSTQTEQLQQQTGTEGTYPTQPGQSGTGMGNEQPMGTPGTYPTQPGSSGTGMEDEQAPTQTEELQEQTDPESTYPTQ